MIFWLLPLAILVPFWLAFTIAVRRPPPATVLLRAELAPCGCLRLEGGLVLPLCPAHDPAAESPVEQWAAEIGEDL